jgi:hypothetical protein
VPLARAASVDAVGPVIISSAEPNLRRTAERDITPPHNRPYVRFACYRPARHPDRHDRARRSRNRAPPDRLPGVDDRVRDERDLRAHDAVPAWNLSGFTLSPGCPDGRVRVPGSTMAGERPPHRTLRTTTRPQTTQPRRRVPSSDQRSGSELRGRRNTPRARASSPTRVSARAG